VAGWTTGGPLIPYANGFELGHASGTSQELDVPKSIAVVSVHESHCPFDRQDQEDDEVSHRSMSASHWQGVGASVGALLGR
jgi:hypothetical protein